MGKLLLGAILGAAVVYGAFSYHLVKSSEGFHIVAKRSPTLRDTYVDVRKFGLSEWTAHRDLAADLMAANKSRIVGDEAATWLRSSFDNTMGALQPPTRQ